MKKNKVFYGIISFIMALGIFITPTLGKYVYSNTGVAGFLVFTPLIPTGIFVVENDNFIGENGEELDEVKSESKWGTKGETVENPENEFGLGTLDDVQFSVSNKSSKRLLVSFYIEVYSSGTLNAEWVNNKITINNLSTGESINGKFTYSGKDNNIYKETVNPTDKNIFTDVTTTVIENSFVLDENEYFDYQVVIERSYDGIGGIIGGFVGIFTEDYYYNFNMILTEYN